MSILPKYVSSAQEDIGLKVTLKQTAASLNITAYHDIPPVHITFKATKTTRVQKALKIALDVDSVLADVIITWLKVYQKLYGGRLKKADVNTWDFWKKLNLSRRQFGDIFTETWNRWEQIPPTEEDLAEKVIKLRALGTVDIVTGRSIETVPHVKEWLNRHNIEYEKFVRVPTNSFKGDLEYDVFIDDSPHNVIGAAGKNRYSLLYDQPWNQDVAAHPNIFRVKNLSEAIEVIKRLRLEGRI
ncbi:MAG: hypothetical protein ACE5KU_00840 [Nitrososphaerales archaeon]